MIVGAAVIVPEVISDGIIQPASGTVIENAAGLSCDRVLKNQSVSQRAALNAARMNAVIKQIHAQPAECAADMWTLVVVDGAAAADHCSTDGKTGGSDFPRGCRLA